MKSLSESVGQKIRDCRESIRPKMSQAKLGDAIGVDSQTVSNWERGLYIPQREHLETISRIFARPVGYFLDQNVELTQAPQVSPTVDKLLEVIRSQEKELETLRSRRLTPGETTILNAVRSSPEWIELAVLWVATQDPMYSEKYLDAITDLAEKAPDEADRAHEMVHALTKKHRPQKR